jgi:hypothetical protein
MTLFQALSSQSANKIGQFCNLWKKLNTSSLLSPCVQLQSCVACIIENSMACLTLKNLYGTAESNLEHRSIDSIAGI